MPVYGTGENVRDWLYVEDHARRVVEFVGEVRRVRTEKIGRLHEDVPVARR